MGVILVVEDDLNAASILEHQLRQAGHDVYIEIDPSNAWTAAVRLTPDVAVVDVMLGSESGWTFVERARADARFSRLPMVIVAGSGRQEDEQRAKQLGYAYFSKPYTTRVLVDRVSGLVGQGPQPGRASIAAVTTLRAIRVVLVADRYQIEGSVHLAPELERFSDGWESLLRDRREFIPLTDARISATDASGYTAEVGFIEVRKADVIAAFPVQSGHGSHDA